MSNRTERKRARLERELSLLAGQASVERKVGVDESRQPRFGNNASVFASVFRWAISAINEEPPESSGAARYDAWLRAFVNREPLLAGVLSSVVAIDTNRGWTIEGGRNQVRKYTNILKNADDGAGWRAYMSWQSQSYHTARIGFVTELGREGEDGPLRAIWSVDPAQCTLTGFADYPLRYMSAKGGQSDWAAGSFLRAASMPSTNERLLGYGFPAAERCLSLAKIMVGVLSHFKQQVLTEVPEGILTGKNISQAQWDTALEHYGEALQGYSDKFARLMSLMSEGDAAPELAITWFRHLPEGFNLNDWISILMYGYALAFGYDPREFWPVSGGQLGTAKESEVQHRKATSKTIDFSLAFQEQLQSTFPESLSFEFQSRDVEGDTLEAQAKQAKANYIQTLAGLTIDGKSVYTREQIINLCAEEEIVPDDYTIFEEPTKETDTDENLKKDLADDQVKPNLQEIAEKPAIQEAVRRFPDEPIVRYYSARDNRPERWQVLFKPGQLARHSFPVSRALKDFTSEYKYTLRDLAGQVRKGSREPKDMAIEHRRLLKETARGIYEEGLRLAGIDELDEYDEAQIRDWLAGQLPYVLDFAKSAKETDADPSQWVAALEVLGRMAKVSANENQMGTWQYGQTDHCQSCKELHGQRHRVRWFIQRGFIPREPGSEALQCGGWNCQCTIVNDNGKRIL